LFREVAHGVEESRGIVHGETVVVSVEGVGSRLPGSRRGEPQSEGGGSWSLILGEEMQGVERKEIHLEFFGEGEQGREFLHVLVPEHTSEAEEEMLATFGFAEDRQGLESRRVGPRSFAEQIHDFSRRRVQGYAELVQTCFDEFLCQRRTQADTRTCQTGVETPLVGCRDEFG